jgi:hypothetical protein
MKKRIGMLFAIMFVLSVAVHAQTITITLSGNDTGWLNCPEANVSTQCWFKSTTPIKQTGVYSGQVSQMKDHNNRPGIIIFNGPINLDAGRGIFIHVGSKASDSDNCVVIPSSEMNKLYNSLEKKYRLHGQEFTIHVTR